MTCAVESCDSKAKAKGWCPKHYQQFRRYGTPEPLRRLCVVCGNSTVPHVSREGRCYTCHSKATAEERRVALAYKYKPASLAVDYRLRLEQIAALVKIAINLPHSDPGATHLVTERLFHLMLEACEGNLPEIPDYLLDSE